MLNKFLKIKLCLIIGLFKNSEQIASLKSNFLIVIKNGASYFVSSSYFSFTFSENSRMFPTYLRGCFISGM
jgi:hypothetical protein